MQYGIVSDNVNTTAIIEKGSSCNIILVYVMN